MIPLVTLRDEAITVSRGRSAGQQSRRHSLVAVDGYNIVLAEGSSDVPTGKSFVGKMTHLCNVISNWDGLDVENCRKLIARRFCEIFDVPVDEKMSWAEMDATFEVPVRESDSTGRLTLYRRLKEVGLQDDEKSDLELSS